MTFTQYNASSYTYNFNDGNINTQSQCQPNAGSWARWEFEPYTLEGQKTLTLSFSSSSTGTGSEYIFTNVRVFLDGVQVRSVTSATDLEINVDMASEIKIDVITSVNQVAVYNWPTSYGHITKMILS